MALMTPWEFANALVEAGVITQDDANHAARIVIDAQMDSPVIVYVQRYGDIEALKRLAPMLDGLLRDGEETADIKRPERASRD